MKVENLWKTYRKKFPVRGKGSCVLNVNHPLDILDIMGLLRHTSVMDRDLEDDAEGTLDEQLPPQSKHLDVPIPQGILTFDDLETGQHPLDAFVIGIYLDIAANGDSDEVRLKAAEAISLNRGLQAKAEVKAGKYRSSLPLGPQQNNFIFTQEAQLKSLMQGLKCLGLQAAPDPDQALERSVAAEGV